MPSLYCSCVRVLKDLLEKAAGQSVHFTTDLWSAPSGQHAFLSLYFGVPLASEKMVLPTTCLEFLGITIDNEIVQFSLPLDKVSKLPLLIDYVCTKRKVVLKMLQSLLGLLAFASRVIPVGRVFFRRLYKSVSSIKSSLHFVCITASLRKDLVVWKKSYLISMGVLSGKLLSVLIKSLTCLPMLRVL